MLKNQTMSGRRTPSFIVAVSLCAVLILAACSNNSSQQRAGEQAAQPERQPAAQESKKIAVEQTKPDARPVIVAFGDSLTAGVSGKSYPALLQDVLDRNGFAYQVQNQGVSGDTTTDGLARIDYVTSAHPALVILEFGGNDGLRGVPVSETQKNLEQMIQKIQAAKIPLVLAGITLPPNYGPDYVKPFTAIFPSLAKQYRVRYMPFLLAHVYQQEKLMQPDGIHPNETGNAIVAKDVFELIRPMLGKPVSKKTP